MKKVIYSSKNALQDTIYLPSSKSISNRMLIIHALAGSGGDLHGLSDSDDTRVLTAALEHPGRVKDVGHAGTAMRFLTAYLSTLEGHYTLTGSERMKQRPLSPLLKALKELGAQITCLEKKGYPPLEIEGGQLKGGTIHIDAGISSQFISALMMVAPYLKGGLKLVLEGRVVSATYTEMTASLMRSCGAEVEIDGKQVSVKEGKYRVDEFTVEADWSAASYWYEIVALLPGSEIMLSGLSEESLQGDSVLKDLFAPLGVQTMIGPGGMCISLQNIALPGMFEYDFTACPDLVQTMAVTLCARGVPFRFTGTSTLRVKETDRIAALGAELKKFGFVLSDDPAGEWMAWDGTRCKEEENPMVATYHDHRMAMAFAPLALVRNFVTIKDPSVVSKSYPAFWDDMEKAGFKMT